MKTTESPSISVIVPVVHMNGDSKQTLIENYFKSVEALDNAIECLPEVHGRNYYKSLDEDLLDKAIAQKDKWREKLNQIKKEMEEILIQIDDQ